MGGGTTNQTYQLWVNNSCSEERGDHDEDYACTERITAGIYTPHQIAMQQALDAAIISEQVGRPVSLGLSVGQLPALTNPDMVRPSSVVQVFGASHCSGQFVNSFTRTVRFHGSADEAVLFVCD
eukprot:SAG31_NODE_241_length_19364_cov_17.168544_11_plen_124_part_00